MCPTCGEPLTWTMLHCSVNRHRQRLTNAFVLVGLPLVLFTVGTVIESPWLWPAYGVFSVTMVLLGITDIDTKLIPNRILGPATVAFAVLLVAGWALDASSGSVLRAGLGAVAYFAAMYALALVARGGLGFGDVKLAFLIGMATGFFGWGPVILAGVLGFVIGGLTSIVLLVTRRLSRKDAIPFGPFMIVGGFIAVLWGTGITDWYLR